jgi:hypothetical protein
MKNIYLREIRHIVANHSLRNKSTAYCFKSKSIVFKIIRQLIKQKLLECINTDGPFLFVRPSEKLIAVFGTVGIVHKTSKVSTSQSHLNLSNSLHNSHYTHAGIIAT